MKKSTVLKACMGVLCAAAPFFAATPSMAQSWTPPSYVQSGTEYFASPSYNARMFGYDWVGLKITHPNDDKIEISVESRKDIKKETCHAEFTAYKVAPNTYRMMINTEEVFFRYNPIGISVITPTISGAHALMFYCSGGGTLNGSYTRVRGPL